MMSGSILQLFSEPVELKCPTCGLAFQETHECRRCKTDLTLLMQTAVYSWKLREKARWFLLHNEYDEALRHAEKAQAIHRTKIGALLEQLAVTAIEKRRSAGAHLQRMLFE